MIKRDTEDITIAEGLPLTFSSMKDVRSPHKRTLPLSMLFLGPAFVICTLLMVSPLSRVVGSPTIDTLSTSNVLKLGGAWISSDFHFPTDQKNSILSTNIILYLILTAVAFLIYGFSIWSVQRLPPRGNYRSVVSIIVLVMLISGMIFVLTPAMLSHDIFVYAGYGRLITAHDANPYFTPLKLFPHDPITPLDDWSWAVAAYGPAWLAICAAFAWISGTQAIHYIIAFRLLGFCAYLLNALLIYKILQKTGHTPRMVVLGTLFYAWNPLALMESSLGGHNDTIMMTFILWGIWLYIRGEQRGLTRSSSYLPPIIAFTFAALIKFTSGLLIFFFLVILIRKALFPIENTSGRNHLRSNWFSALLKPLFACMASGLFIFGFYIPYWVGHSIPSIIASFSAPPSSRYAKYSMLSAINTWVAKYGYPPKTLWTYTLLKVCGNQGMWNIINAIIIMSTIIVGIVWLCRKPTIRVFLLTTLLTLSLLLVMTPWFFPWYIVWLIAPAPLILPYAGETIGRVLTAFALVFSASAYFVYFFGGYQPIGLWIGLDFLTTIGPPILAFLLIVIFRKLGHSRLHRTSRFVLFRRETKT